MDNPCLLDTHQLTYSKVWSNKYTLAYLYWQSHEEENVVRIQLPHHHMSLFCFSHSGSLLDHLLMRRVFLFPTIESRKAFILLFILFLFNKSFLFTKEKTSVTR